MKKNVELTLMWMSTQEKWSHSQIMSLQIKEENRRKYSFCCLGLLAECSHTKVCVRPSGRKAAKQLLQRVIKADATYVTEIRSQNAAAQFKPDDFIISPVLNTLIIISHSTKSQVDLLLFCRIY